MKSSIIPRVWHCKFVGSKLQSNANDLFYDCSESVSSCGHTACLQLSFSDDASRYGKQHFLFNNKMPFSIYKKFLSITLLVDTPRNMQTFSFIFYFHYSFSLIISTIHFHYTFQISFNQSAYDSGTFTTKQLSFKNFQWPWSICEAKFLLLYKSVTIFLSQKALCCMWRCTSFEKRMSLIYED